MECDTYALDSRGIPYRKSAFERKKTETEKTEKDLPSELLCHEGRQKQFRLYLFQ